MPLAEKKTLIGMPTNLQDVLRAADAAIAARAAASSARPSAPASSFAEPSTRLHGSDGPRAPEPRAAEPRMHLQLDEHEERGTGRAEPNPLATRHAAEHLGKLLPDDEATDVVRPRLALSERTTKRTVAPARKLWPALSLLGAAVVIGGGLLIWQNLRSPAARGAQAEAGPGVVLAPAPALPSTAREPVGVPPMAPSTVTDVSAATQERAALKPAAPAVMVQPQGSAPELEKQAIELLIAKDYANAARVYERLRALEPERREYAAMYSMLTRSAGTCGRPGQEPCTR